MSPKWRYSIRATSYRF